MPFEEVYNRYAPDVYRLCLFALRDPAAAEDVTADVFVSVLANLGKAEIPGENVRFWVIRIARNAVIDRKRREARWRGIVSNLRRERRPTTDIGEVAELRHDVSVVLDALSTMSKRDQMLVSLRCGADLSFEEIGNLTGMPAKSAAMATYRALDRLRSRLGGGDA